MSSHLKVDNTLGATLIGILISFLLMGIVIVQTHTYYRKFPGDSTWTKTLVTAVFLLDVGQTICMGHVLYYFAVTGYGQPLTLIHPPKSFGFDCLLTVMLRVVVQLYFSYRIWKLTKKLILPLISVVLSVVALVFGLIIASNAITLTSVPELEAKIEWLLPASLSFSAAIDVYIAVTLVVWLTVQRTRAIKSTSRVLDKLIAWSIQTGVLTSITAIVLVIIFVTMRNNYIWLTFYAFLPKLYSNSLLSILNGRLALRDMRGGVVEMSISIGGDYDSNRRNRSPISGRDSTSSSQVVTPFTIGLGKAGVHGYRHERAVGSTEKTPSEGVKIEVMKTVETDLTLV